MEMTEVEVYLNELVAQIENMKTRIEPILEFHKEIGLGDVNDIFITDYVDEKGIRSERFYDDLWLFSENYWVEVKQFQTKYDYTITPGKERVLYINIKKDHYDFNEATDYSESDPEIHYSRMSLYVALDGGLAVAFKAAGKNCDHLKAIILKYVMPNLKK